MPNEILYPASRVKALLLFVGCLAFVALGVLIAKQNPLVGWLGVAFFELGLPAFLCMLLPNRVYLKLNPPRFRDRITL